MSAVRPSSAERLAILEQKVSHVETELGRMAAKVDEMHAILLQPRRALGVIAVSGLVGFLTGISHCSDLSAIVSTIVRAIVSPSPVPCCLVV